MISYWWLLPAFISGFATSFVVISLCTSSSYAERENEVMRLREQLGQRVRA